MGWGTGLRVIRVPLESPQDPAGWKEKEAITYSPAPSFRAPPCKSRRALPSSLYTADTSRPRRRRVADCTNHRGSTSSLSELRKEGPTPWPLRTEEEGSKI